MSPILKRLSIIVSVLVAAAVADAGDVVRIAPAEGGSAFGIEGQILDYTGREIAIRPASGTERRYPTDRVAEIRTTWPSGYEEGLEALEEQDFRGAQQHFIAANQAEPRPWARRIILGGLARALLGLGRVEQAADVVLAVLASDPTSSTLELLPLAWASDAQVPQAKADAWLSRSNHSAGKLLGASYLLAAARQADAVAVLRRLTADTDTRIAALAEAQLWRIRVATADAAEVRRWQAAIERIPTGLRAGPSYVAGQALRRLGEHDAAALALLRVPIHAPEHAELAARALLDAAEALSDAGHPQEALRLAEEVVRDYAATSSAKPAEQFVRKLQN